MDNNKKEPARDVPEVNETEEREQVQERQEQVPEMPKKTFNDLLREDPEFQSAFDKRVQQSIETARTKWEAQAKLTEEERAAQALKDREEAISKREMAQTLRERTADIRDALRKGGLPASLAGMIAETTEDGEEAGRVIAELQTAWQEELQQQIKSAARQKDPVATQAQQQTTKSFSAQLEEMARKTRRVE